jgi:hypothetical protein
VASASDQKRCRNKSCRRFSYLVNVADLIGAVAEGNQLDFMTNEISQTEGFHEIDNAVEHRIEETSIVPNHGDTQGRSLVYILILDLRHGRIETMAALLDQALDHFALVLKRLVAMKPELYSRNPDRHKVGS